MHMLSKHIPSTFCGSFEVLILVFCIYLFFFEETMWISCAGLGWEWGEMAIFQMTKEIKFSSSRLGKHPELSRIKDELEQGQKKRGVLWGDMGNFFSRMTTSGVQRQIQGKLRAVYLNLSMH